MAQVKYVHSSLLYDSPEKVVDGAWTLLFESPMWLCKWYWRCILPRLFVKLLVLCEYYGQKWLMQWSHGDLEARLPQYGALLSPLNHDGMNSGSFSKRMTRTTHIHTWFNTSAGNTWPSSSYQISLSWLSVSIKNQCWTQSGSRSSSSNLHGHVSKHVWDLDRILRLSVHSIFPFPYSAFIHCFSKSLIPNWQVV